MLGGVSCGRRGGVGREWVRNWVLRIERLGRVEDGMKARGGMLDKREAVAVVKIVVQDVITQLKSATRARGAIVLMVCGDLLSGC